MLSTSGKSSQQLHQITAAKDQVAAETWLTAQTWLDRLDQVITEHHMVWLEPLINISPQQEIVLEWWHNSKKLTVYVENTNAEYVQVWGSDIDREMVDGSASNASEVEVLWRWLIN